jgi:hypothetical protein
MDGRQQRGVEIAATAKILKNRLGWKVPSQTGQGSYVVSMDGEPFCSCPDFEKRGLRCKHIWAVEFTVRRESQPDGTVSETRSVRVTYRQDWAAYNAAQVEEKDRFQVLLHDLCSGLQRPEPQRRGRPRIPLSDAIFAATFKVYSTVSGRRFMSDLRAAHERGHVDRVPCYNSIFNVMDDPETAGVFDLLIGESALPLKALESSFACDSSGFSASRFDRWFDHKHGERRMKRSWVKAHIMCGVRTNVVTALEIHGRDANDSPLLPPLLNATAERFDVQEVSADLGYSSVSNLQAITSAGASALIPFKHNATPAKGGLWARMFHFYSLHRDEFLSRYHLRSNVETTFHMVKAKFGDSVRSKTDRAMANEVRAKILCHNICCLIQSAHEFGVDLSGLSQAA